MPWYEYEGQCAGGTAISGRIEAASREAAQDLLTQNLTITLNDLRTGPSPPPSAPISENEFLFFNEQLASLASAGLALDEGLQQLARDVESKRLKTFIEAVVADLRRGEPLDQAVAKHESRLPVLYGQVIRAGMKSGQLPATLLGLNQHMRLMAQTRRVLWETVSYPLFVLVAGFVILSVFLLKVVPQFKAIFADFGTRLPGPTVLMLEMADNFPAIAIGVGVCIAVIAGGWHLLRLWPRGRWFREELISRLPLIGQLYRASLVTRFVRTMSTSVRLGMPLPDSLRLAGGTTGSPHLSGEADRLAEAVERGEPIFAAGQLCTWIPGLFGYTVQVASGRDVMPAALAQLAESYESRAMHLQSMVKAVVFPLVVIGTGVFIAFGVMGLFLPLVSLVNAVGG